MVMKFIKFILLNAILLLSSINAFSSHLSGGEIAWACNGSGQYIFTVKLYRDCNGIGYPASINLETNAPGFSSGILCNLDSAIDISPVGPNCPTCANPQAQPSAINEVIYKSGLVSLTGVPQSTGWYFSYADCCRNGTNNLNGSGSGYFILRAIMYPYNGQDAAPCFDNSPQFAERPLLATCVGSTVNYSHSAFDPDLDSLTFEWAHPLDGTTFLSSTNYQFSSGYSYNSPLPDTAFNPSNIPATLDSSTGLINFLSNTQGVFVTVIKVTSYKCGVKTAEIFREIQIALLNCVISGTTLNTSPDITGGLSVENHYLLAGDSINLLIGSTDFEMLPSSAGGGFQRITLTHFGQNFGDGDTSTTSGCLIPPCATMSPATPFSNLSSVSSTFNYVTNCGHAGFISGCLQHQRLFSFAFKFNDNFCPANGSATKIVNVYVSGPEIQLVGNDLTISYPGATFQWYLNGNPIVGAIDTIYTPVQSGIYTVIATNPGGCSMISNAVNRVFSGIENASLKSKSISIYPNPTAKGGMLNVVVNGINSKDNLLQVLDINGRLVKQFNVHLNSESEHLVLDVSDISAGVYTLSLNNGSEIISEGFLIK